MHDKGSGATLEKEMGPLSEDTDKAEGMNLDSIPKVKCLAAKKDSSREGTSSGIRGLLGSRGFSSP